MIDYHAFNTEETFLQVFQKISRKSLRNVSSVLHVYLATERCVTDSTLSIEYPSSHEKTIIEYCNTTVELTMMVNVSI